MSSGRSVETSPVVSFICLASFDGGCSIALAFAVAALRATVISLLAAAGLRSGANKVRRARLRNGDKHPRQMTLSCAAARPEDPQPEDGEDSGNARRNQPRGAIKPSAAKQGARTLLCGVLE